jgi:hypothetical protein
MSLANSLRAFGRFFDQSTVAFLMILGLASASAVVLLGL